MSEFPAVGQSPGNGLTFFGADSILFWTKPSLISMLKPLQEELGEDLYSLLIAFESFKGTYEDYHSIVEKMGPSFEEGFAKWGAVVASCGWGAVRLESIDWERKEARVRVDNPWEFKLFRFRGVQNSAPFLNGKIAGIFSYAFGTGCRAEVVELSNDHRPYVTFLVRPSQKTLEDALLELHGAEWLSEKDRLRALNNALRRNEQRLLGVIETVGEFIWETDRHLSITYVTDKAFEILPISRDSVLGKTWKDLLGPAEFGRLTQLVDSLGPDREFVEADFMICIAEQETRTIHLRVKHLVDFSGNRNGFIGSGRDITQQVQLEARLLEQKKASEFAAKMAALGEMAGGMAHEINTPLATITLLAERLIGESQESGSRETAEAIMNTAFKIDKIVQGLRSFARDTSADPCVPAEVGALIEDTLGLCRTRFANHGVSLRIGPIPAGTGLKCRPTQIVQVLVNLLNNAYDAVADLSEKWIGIDVLHLENRRLQIRISDSGPRIKDEVREKMMNPFFTTKPIGKGMGLGLSLSSGIIESHGGTLRYDARSPHTCFVVEMPLEALS